MEATMTFDPVFWQIGALIFICLVVLAIWQTPD